MSTEKPEEPAKAPAPSPAPTPEPAPPAAAPAPEPAAPLPPEQRNGVLLGLGISTLAMALAAEGLAWAAYVEGNDTYDDEPDFEKYRVLNIAGHVVAGAMALTSGVLFYFWYVSGEPRPAGARVGVLPLPGGVTASASFRF